jgi:type I restriction enzyme M protein
VAVTIYGQTRRRCSRLGQDEYDLHNNPTARIEGYSTLSHPQFLRKSGQLEQFSFSTSNPPFSLKNWSDGFTPSSDVYERFLAYRNSTR